MITFVVALVSLVTTATPNDALVIPHAVSDMRLLAGGNSSEDDALRAMLDEMVKSQILEKLNLKEPPRPSPAIRRMSKEVVRLLAKEADHQFRKEYSEDEDSVVLYANNSDFRCLETDGTSCKRFEFVLPSNFVSATPMDFWFHRENESFPSSFLLFFCSDDPDNVFHYLISTDNETETGWTKVELPKELIRGTGTDELVCQVEVNGLNVTEDGDRRPFLLVAKDTDIQARKRRSNSGNNTCQRKPFTVKFSDIGFDSFILEPAQYVAYFCSGECWKDRSSSRSFYQTVITETFEKNKTLVDTHGLCWASCCRPTRFSHLHVLYADENYIHNKKLTNMVVEACGCS